MKTKRKTRRNVILWLALCVLALSTLAGCGDNNSRVMPEEEAAVTEYGDIGFTETYDSAAGSSGDNLIDEEDLREDDAKLIRTVDMSLETTEFDSLLDILQSRTEEMGGYVESSDVSSPGENVNRRSYMTIRIPTERLDEFLAVVGENANVTYTGESVEDVTLRYVDLETHVNELRIEQETLQSMLEEAESVDDILAIQAQLTEIRYEIESYASQLKVLENRVSYSTVYLNISEVDRETSAAALTFGESVRARLGDNMYRFRVGLRSFAIGFLGALPFIIVAAVVALVVFLIIRGIVRHRRRKNKGRRNSGRKKDKDSGETERDPGGEDKDSGETDEGSGEEQAADN